MNTNNRFAQSISRRKTGLGLAVGLPALLIALPLICAEHGGAPRAAAARSATWTAPAMAASATSIPMSSSARSRCAAEPAPSRRSPPRSRPPRGRGVLVHHDVEVDFHRRHFWNDFAFGRRLAALPLGFLALHIGGVPYFYCDGIYYQPADGGYQEVYPPVGAAVPQPPDGAIAIEAGGQTYYYAGGAFYLQQPDGTYAIAPTPIGVVVPELPPGAIQVSVRGTIAYQFNGIYYEPVFVNGVTQYETFMP